MTSSRSDVLAGDPANSSMAQLYKLAPVRGKSIGMGRERRFRASLSKSVEESRFSVEENHAQTRRPRGAAIAFPVEPATAYTQCRALILGARFLVRPSVETHFMWRPQLRDPADEFVLEAAGHV